MIGVVLILARYNSFVDHGGADFEGVLVLVSVFESCHGQTRQEEFTLGKLYIFLYAYGSFELLQLVS